MTNTNNKDLEAIETKEWLESLDYVLQSGGPERVERLLEQLTSHAYESGVRLLPGHTSGSSWRWRGGLVDYQSKFCRQNGKSQIGGVFVFP